MTSIKNIGITNH